MAADPSTFGVPAPDGGTIADAYDRHSVKGAHQVIFRDGIGYFSQGAEINEALSIQDQKRKSIGDMVANDGDVVDGNEIFIDKDAETATIGSGRIYFDGQASDVPAAVLTSVPMTGRVVIGVRQTETLVDENDDDDLLGFLDEASAEPGAVRVMSAFVWGFDGDGGSPVIPVYRLEDGTVIDQTPPPGLSDIEDFVARYDRGAHGNYIVSGAECQAVAKEGNSQRFSIGAFEANIYGRKRTRNVDSVLVVEESPDVGEIVGEVHYFEANSGPNMQISVRATPVSSVETILIEKEATDTLIKGVTNSSETLSNTSVLRIVSVAEGGTAYTADTDYVLDGNTISWAPGGAEPDEGDSYTVTYRYLDAVSEISFDNTSITVGGGVAGGQIILSYFYKLPRIDRICVNTDGQIVYVEGQSARVSPRAPIVAETLLSLATISNNWVTKPAVSNDGVRSYPFETIDSMYNRMVDVIDIVAIERAKRDIDSREPGTKLAILADNFENERYLDSGSAQTLSVVAGTAQLAVDTVQHNVRLPAPLMLPYVEETILEQDFVTDCGKINPYQNFAPPPLEMTLVPAQDFWTQRQEVVTPVDTVFLGQGNSQRVLSEEQITVVETDEVETLRTIAVQFTVKGLGDGEALTVLTFDGRDVLPDPAPVANAQGVVTGNFNIPAGVPTGIKPVVAFGADQTRPANATFRGSHSIQTTIRGTLRTVERFNSVAPVSSAGSNGRRDPVKFQQWTWGTDSNPNSSSPESGFAGGGRFEVIDPVAQSLALPLVGRFITSFEARICNIGDRANEVLADIVTTSNGIATNDIIARARKEGADLIQGNWNNWTFERPVFLPENTFFAVALKTDDADHSVSHAKLGGFDAAKQQHVTAQPYTVGDMQDGSNGVSYRTLPDQDLTHRLNAARFTQNILRTSLDPIAVVNLTDLLIQADILLPTDDCAAFFEVQLGAGGEIYRIEAGRPLELLKEFTGNLLITIVLNGSSLASPQVSQDIVITTGTMREFGVIVYRAGDFGSNVNLHARTKSLIPGEATLKVEYDLGADDNWTEITAGPAEALNDGWFDRGFVESSVAAADNLRFRVTLTGTPASRPSLATFRAFSLGAN
jgi:hypothetical protein